MRKETSFLAVGLVLGALLTATVFVFIQRQGPADAAGRTVLKLAHALDQSHPVHAGMEYMAERLIELSGGQMEIQIFPNGQLGSEPETIEQLQRGAVDMVKTSTAAMEGFVSEMAVFGLPYLFRDDEHYWNVLNGEIGRELLAAGDAVGIHGLCYYDSGSRSFYTIDEPILTPEDVAGEKIRTLPSRMAMDLISTLDGAPTPIPWGELYTALQQRMVDGAENNPPSYLSSRHYEVAKHFSLDEHTRIPDMVIFSHDTWIALTAQQQAWVNQAAAESVTFQRQLWAEKTEEALAAVAAAGVTLYRPDKAPFIAATQSMYDRIADSPIGQLATRIRAVP